MTHPYESYITQKAGDYYSRQKHESHCETEQPSKLATDDTGFVYDVAIVKHCDCWLSENFDNLTTERMFEALRDLSYRFGLHSPSCGRYRKESITYRNKPETLRFPCNCWLSVPFPKDQTCPVCQAPLFFAPNAPDDTTKKACSDINCVNAHGIKHHEPIDTWESIEVDYEKPQATEQEQPMSDLSRAITLAEAAEQAQIDIDNFLAPFIEQFVQFKEDTPSHWDFRDSKADTFKELDGKTFWIVGEETYQYGEYYNPSFNLPFEFVDNPAAYKKEQIRLRNEKEAKEKAARKRSAEETVARLERQLAEARKKLVD